MKNSIKSFLIPALVAILVSGIIGFSIAGSQLTQLVPANEFLAKLISDLKSLNETHPEERVYLHFDKPFYKPGESVWFRAYLRNGRDFKPSLQSDIIHVELINPKGTVEKELKLISRKGLASGDFYLGENAAGGIYKIKAYTNWQKNEVNAAIFEKELTVQAVTLPLLKMKLDFERKAYGKGDNVSATVSFKTLENKALAGTAVNYVVNLDGKKILQQKTLTSEEGEAYIDFKLPADLSSNDGILNVMISHEGNTESISRSIPIVLNKIDFTLFPEGGDLVAGLESKVAFRALNEDGKPADIEGFVEDSKGNKICDIRSFHSGMGAFRIKPEKKEKYFVKITRPANIEEKFQLPDAFERGYILNVNEIRNNEMILTVSSSENEELSLICTVRDEVYHTSSVKASYGENKVRIPLADFPAGVARITLFDKRGIERAERLVFVNKHKQLKVTVETDKEKYLPREKVKMILKVTDERGMPMPGNFSISVADDKLLSFADDRSGNILSKLLLEYDLKEKVEEPSFYFNPKESNADLALDYLLMTSGWRRFTWKQITEKELPAIAYAPEKAIISGTVYDQNGKPLPKAKVEIAGKNLHVITNEEGRYYFHGVELYNAVVLQVNSPGLTPQSRTITEYAGNIDFRLYNQVLYNYSEGNKKYKSAGVPKMDAAKERRMIRADGEDFIMEGELFPQMAPVNNFAVNLPEAKDKAAEEEVAWNLDDELGEADLNAEKRIGNNKPVMPQTYYYRAREFSSPVYDKEEKVELRTDFRSTIYWNGNVETDRSGKAVIEFYNSDEISSFRIVAEGISADGMIGRTESTYFTQLPFSMAVKAPVEVTAGDIISLPLTLKNNTGSAITGKLAFNAPEGLDLTKPVSADYTLLSKESKTIYLNFRARQVSGISKLEMAFSSQGLSDAFVQNIKVSPRGFPANISFSGSELEKEYTFNISSPVEGSLEASFTAFPSVVSDLMKGIEGIIREPYGCFEQTSTSNYPNLLIKKYIQNTQGGGQQGGQGGNNKKPIMPEGLDSKLEKGYGRLVSYETKEKGYEWFGGTPAHEALTAYGLMQFNDMKDVYGGVNDAMVSRTSDWLMSRRDGKGGFLRSEKALDRFGRASEDVTNGYIVYALSEAGQKGIDKEAMTAYEKAMSSKDPYLVALTANTMINLKKVNESRNALKLLKDLQAKEGSWTGASHSITRSEGNSLVTETSSLALLALLKAPSGNHEQIQKAANFIVGQRSGYGDFGSTQATVLALKALTAFAEYSKKTDEAGTIEIYVNGNKVNTISYQAGQRDPLSAKNLEKYLKEGKNKVRVKYIGAESALPYSFSISYHSKVPKSSDACKVNLSTKLASSSAKVGETVRMNAVLTNKTNDGLPMTMAIIGIPAGLSAQPWQLKELQEKGIFDFYEIRENRLIIYYRQMEPGQKKEINLDLKAEIPGDFEGSASCAYLYYGNENKVWVNPERISIRQ
jgi:hypothetical protein